jgi:hypothetical protein
MNFLGHYLLDKHEAPKLVFEPIEILLRPSFVPLLGHSVRSSFHPASLEVVDERNL